MNANSKSLLFFGKILFLSCTLCSNVANGKKLTCAQYALKEAQRITKTSKEFHCSKFTVGLEPTQKITAPHSTLSIEPFEIKVKCANPGVWIKYRIMTKIQNKTCKTVDVEILSQSIL